MFFRTGFCKKSLELLQGMTLEYGFTDKAYMRQFEIAQSLFRDWMQEFTLHAINFKVLSLSSTHV